MKGKTIVVGGGPGGLSAAIHLAASGRQVLLLEKEQGTGWQDEAGASVRLSLGGEI